MDLIISSGRFLFAIAVAALGAENLIWAAIGDPNSPIARAFVYTPIMPFVPLLAGSQIAVYVTGIALLAAGLLIAFNQRPRLSAIFVGIFLLICTLLLELPRSIAAPMDIGVRTLFFETLALSATAFTLAELLPSGPPNFLEHSPIVDRLINLGPGLFAVSLAVFGVDHFLILDFIARLVPIWLPGAMFWSWFTGAAFIAAGVSIAIKRLDYWAGFWLGTMLMLYVLLLHGPRVASYPKSYSPDEWSSALIALAMWGAGWIFAVHARRQTTRVVQPVMRKMDLSIEPIIAQDGR